MLGPYPIFCRGHSGGRILCEAFARNHIQMGHLAPGRNDTEYFSITNPFLRHLILHAYHYPHAQPAERQYDQELMRRCLTHYLQTEIPYPAGPFGWKHGISLFTLPVLMDTFPTAKIIHLIRDGRDVMLSRLEARFGGDNLSDPVNQLVVFGNSHTHDFEGHLLTPETIATYRNELEMLHWVTAVRYGLQGRHYPGRYLEIKYEDLCQNPVLVLTQIFDFINIRLLSTTRQWIIEAVHQTRIGKWQNLSPQQLDKPLQIGGELLKELGYLR